MKRARALELVALGAVWDSGGRRVAVPGAPESPRRGDPGEGGAGLTGGLVYAYVAPRRFPRAAETAWAERIVALTEHYCVVSARPARGGARRHAARAQSPRCPGRSFFGRSPRGAERAAERTGEQAGRRPFDPARGQPPGERPGVRRRLRARWRWRPQGASCARCAQHGGQRVAQARSADARLDGDGADACVPAALLGADAVSSLTRLAWHTTRM
jgi:hypothetical protein